MSQLHQLMKDGKTTEIARLCELTKKPSKTYDWTHERYGRVL